jgi:hypothetical protein
MAVADQVALVPIYYMRDIGYVQPWVEGWWAFGKSCASLADLVVERSAPADPHA